MARLYYDDKWDLLRGDPDATARKQARYVWRVLPKDDVDRQAIRELELADRLKRPTTHSEAVGLQNQINAYANQLRTEAAKAKAS